MEKKNPPLTLRKLAFDFFRLIFPSHLAVSAQQRCSEELRFNHVWLIEGGMETKGEGDGGTGEVLCGYAKYAALFVFCSLSHTHTHTAGESSVPCRCISRFFCSLLPSFSRFPRALNFGSFLFRTRREHLCTVGLRRMKSEVSNRIKVLSRPTKVRY